MLLRNIQDFAAAIGPKARLLGLDVGTKTLGIAISDDRRVIASGRQTIARTKLAKDLATLARLVVEDGVSGMVIGLPLNMDGSEGPRCQSVHQFATDLAKVIDLPIMFWDERLSTMAVTRTMLEADLSRKRRAEIVDKLAAVYILQGALDALGRA